MVEKREEVKLIQIEDKDNEKGFYTLLTNGPAKVLRDNKYLIPGYCTKLLKNAKVNFKELQK